MFSIAEIVKRYNDSISDYVAYKLAAYEHDQQVQDQHLRNAGEGLSQVLEHALKLHAKMHDPTLFARHAYAPTPSIINIFYLDNSGVHKSLYNVTIESGVTPSVDFHYLKSNKRLLTNYSKHEGGNVDPTVVEEYIKQCKLFITEYLDKNALLRDTDYFMEPKQDQIQQFYVACDHFLHEDRTYILLSEKVEGLDHHCYSHFGNAPWDVIVDFYQLSADNGLSAGAYHRGADVPHIYKSSDVVSSEEITKSLRKPLYYYANGFKGERTCSNFNDWNRIYYRKLELFLEAVSKSVTTQKTIVVSLLQDEDFIESIQVLVSRYFSNVKFIIANDPNDELLPLAQRKKDAYEHVKTTVEEIDRCISEYLTAGKTEEINSSTYTVPYIHGEGNGNLTEAELQDLQECFDVLYTNIGDGSDDEQETFLRGESALTWQGAKRGFAAKRERYQRIYEKPLESIVKNGRNKVYIIHEPGYGGSTLARQLAYDFRESYPVLFLKEYRYTSVTEKLAWLHERTRKTIVIFMEIPSVISADDFDYLFRSTNQSRPYVFIGIMRGHANNDGNIHITDWGLDAILLSDKYKPVIESRYSGSEKTAKLAEIQHILSGTVESHKRTPFYFGMLTYEKDFVAADGFYEKFVNAIDGKEQQRKFLIYLSLSDVYDDKPLPEAFFKVIFGVEDKQIFKLENYFCEGDGILTSLVQIETVGNVRYIRPKYPFFSKTLLRKLLRKANTPEDTGWYANLGPYCKEFIEDAARSGVADYLESEIIQPMFIGSSKERDGEHFTRIVEDIQKEDRINIFTTLHTQFPDNPHFCSHLARFYSMEEKDMEKALDYADRAIRLSPNDPLLHHMKGMCLFYIIGERIDDVRRAMKANNSPNQEDFSYITDTLLSQAETEFAKSREIQQKAHHDDEYGYIPNIKLLLRVFDFSVLVNGETKKLVISSAKEPYISWLDKAHTLLEDARRMHEEGKESEHFLTCENSLWQEYEDYSTLLEKLNNQLTQTKHPALIRRQLVQIYMKRDEEYKTSPQANERILNLMSDNMKNDGTNIVNFLLWFKAARYSESLTIDDILTRLAQWNAANPAMDLSFYIFVFNAIKAIEGSSEAAELARKALQECQKLGGNNRIGIKEWYGDAPQGIVSSYERKTHSSDFNLYKVEGYVKEYQHPGNAVIRLDCGLEVFFKPSINGITQSSLNHRVKFSLGFSYDGLRADSESVETIG